MKQIVLIKTSTKPIIAHLYEHLYCRDLTDFFRSHGLMRYIDYDYWAKTYHGGFIHLDVRLYSKLAEKLAGDIAHLDLPLDEQSLTICIYQVSAERQQRLGGMPDKVNASLQELHRQPWTSLDDFGLYDARAIRRTSRELWHGKPDKRLTRTLRLDLVLDKSAVDRAMLPLFHILAKVLGDNIADTLVESFGYYYVNSGGYHYSRCLAQETFTLRVHREAVQALTNELDVCREDIATMLRFGFVKRLTDVLQQATYKTSWLAPDALEAYEAAEILVGAAGWRSLATEANISKLLRQTTLRLAYGRDRQSIELSSL